MAASVISARDGKPVLASVSSTRDGGQQHVGQLLEASPGLDLQDQPQVCRAEFIEAGAQRPHIVG